MVEELIANELKACRSCTCFNLRRTSRAVTRFFDRSLEPSGLAVTQFTLLASLALKGTETINELAKGLPMDRTTLSRNLRPLEREGLVEVVPGKDRRRRLVVLTSSGRQHLTLAFPLWCAAQHQMQQSLKKSDCPACSRT